MKYAIRLFILFIIFSCSSNNKFDKPNIYSGEIIDLQFKTSSKPIKIDESELVLSNLEFFIRIDKEGILDIIVSTQNSGTSFQLNGKLTEYPNTEFKSIEVIDINDPNNIIALNININENGNYVLSNLNNNISFIIHKNTDISFDDFDKLLLNTSKSESFIPFKMNQHNNSVDISDFWLEYFGKNQILQKRKDKLRVEEQAMLKLKEEEQLLKQEMDEQEKRSQTLCDLLMNYDINKYTDYGVSSSALLLIEELRLGKIKNNHLYTVDKKGYIPRNRYSIGFMDDENKLFVKTDGEKVSYTGPFTKLYTGDFYGGAQGLHGRFFELTTDLTSEDLSNYFTNTCP